MLKDNSQKSSFSKIIHVPEGRSGRLIKQSKNYGINGLYTDGFSSCCILSVIAQNKIVLMHLDQQLDPDAVAAEIQWVDEPREVLLMFRELHTQAVATPLMRELHHLLPTQIITLKKVEDEVQGISVSFDTQEGNKVHKQIKVYHDGQHPAQLSRHPQEQGFDAVQKISQLIGVRARVRTGIVAKKQLTIFDGLFWQPLADKEFRIDSSNPLTKEELALLNPKDSCLKLMEKLIQIVSMIQKIYPMKSVEPIHCLKVAFYLEGYFNKFCALECLKNNLLQYINDTTAPTSCYKPNSSADKEFCSELKKLLLQPETTINEITKIIDSYEENSPETQIKMQFIAEYTEFYLANYNERMSYTTQQENHQQMFQSAKRYSQKANQLYRSGQFDAAASLFKDALTLSISCCLKNNKCLATTFYNVGRSLFRGSEYLEAKPYLQYALYLRNSNDQSTPSEIDKVQSALNECVKKIDLADCSKIKDANMVPTIGTI